MFIITRTEPENKLIAPHKLYINQKYNLSIFDDFETCNAFIHI